MIKLYSLEKRMRDILVLLLQMQQLFFHCYSQDVWASSPWWLDASSCARPHPADPPGRDAGLFHPQTAACTRQLYLKRGSEDTGWKALRRDQVKYIVQCFDFENPKNLLPIYRLTAHITPLTWIRWLSQTLTQTNPLFIRSAWSTATFHLCWRSSIPALFDSPSVYEQRDTSSHSTKPIAYMSILRKESRWKLMAPSSTSGAM